jgi:tetratricopeptide (TPR) repeat protein
VARNKSARTGPGSIDDTVARLAVWARRAPRGFSRVEYYSEYARAEADRRLGEVLHREGIPFHRVALPIRVTPSQAGRYLLEHLEAIESGTVSITGLATAVAEEDRRDLLAILSVRREVLAELGLCQIWWLTPDFLDDFIRIAPDLDSWFMIRSKLEEGFLPPDEVPTVAESIGPTGPRYRIEEAVKRAASLVERFHRAKDVGALTPELVTLASSAADAVFEVGAPNLTRELAGQLVSGLNEACQRRLTDCLRTVQSLNSFTRLLISHGRVNEAAPLIDRAWAMVEREGLPDHPETAKDLHNLAAFLHSVNRLDRAEAVMRRALAVAERVHGPWHPSVAHCLKNLAGVLRDTDRLAEAEALCRRALEIDERALGMDHPDVAIDLNNLAVILRAAGRLTEAEPLYRRALEIDERWLGPAHPFVATDLNNLAVLLRAMNRHGEAEGLQRRALEIDERILGPDHPTVATDLVNLALLLQDSGRLAESEPLIRRALAIDERVYEPDSPNIARDRYHLASLLRAMNRLDEAEALPP